MSAYQLYLFVHVAAAIVWVGACLVQAVLGARVVRAGDPARTLVYARECEWSGLHLYAPANLLALASGLLLVFDGGYGFARLWIDLALAGWTLSVLLGGALLKPGWERAAATVDLATERSSLQAAVRRLVVLTTVDLAVLTGVVYDMTVKPTSHQAGSLVVGAVTVVGVLLLAGRLLRSGHEGSGEAEGSQAAAAG